MPVNAPPPGGSGEPAEPLKRRRRHQQQTQEDLDYYALMEESQVRLERAKERHTDAILEQARATNRLAAALERALDILSDPPIINVGNESPPRTP